MKYLFLIGVVLILSSCATQPIAPSNPPSSGINALTSGAVGCPPEQIQISNIKFTGQPPQWNGAFYIWSNLIYTWQAQCNGKVFYCSGPAQEVASDTNGG